MNELDLLVESARQRFAQATTPADLENAKAQFLGKAGRVTELMKGMAALSVEEKKTRGAAINLAKQAIEAALSARRQALADAELEAQLKAEALDVTLPGRAQAQGGLHPVSLTLERIEAIFGSMGFEVAQGPEIETDWFNFTALNTPEDHPARSMHDTFYVEGGYLLRTHTSPHSPMFHQFEGLWLDEDISFADLKSVYTDFLRCFFEQEDLDVRFRPSYFPFTEPSAEIDLRFATGPLKGQWLEVSGAGQVHPQVVRNVGLDPERMIGFAFGSGVERLAMLRYGIADLRLFYENDIRFLQQFRD